MAPGFLAPNADGEGFCVDAPPWKGPFAAGAFEAGFFAKGLGWEAAEVEEGAAKGLRVAAPPLF